MSGRHPHRDRLPKIGFGSHNSQLEDELDSAADRAMREPSVDAKKVQTQDQAPAKRAR